MRLMYGIAVFSLIALFFISIAPKDPRARCDGHTSPVKAVGGCDEFGECGVLLEDGTYLIDARQPVVGVPARGSMCREAK